MRNTINITSQNGVCPMHGVIGCEWLRVTYRLPNDIKIVEDGLFH